MLTRLFAIALLLAACTSVAEPVVTNVWTGAVNDWNWNEAGNFSLGKPSASSVVEIPDPCSVRLLATDDDSLAVVNSLSQIRPTGEGSKLYVVTDSSHNATISCSFKSGEDTKDVRYGELIKQGEGTLTLEKTSDLSAYKSTFTVQQGVLRLPPTGRDGYQHSFSRLTVNQGATLFTVGNRGYTAVYELLGKGMVTNDFTKECYLQINGGTVDNPVKVEAQIGGNVRLYTGGVVYILSEANTMESSTTVRRFGANETSILGLATIGNSGAVGSPGKYQDLYYSEYGGKYLYLGHGEDTSKGINLGINGIYLGVCEFDGGPYGGLNFNYTRIRSTYRNGNLVLSGTNASYCTIGCPVNVYQLSGTNSFVNFTKRGSGAWRFTHSTDRFGIGNVSVEEGAFQYASLYETGDPCSLGVGVTNWPSGYYGLTDPAKLVDYSIALGDPNGETVPAFEYVGDAKGAWNTTRIIAMRGDARLLNSSSDGSGPLPLRLSNFSNIVSRTTKVILEGDDLSAENQVAGLVDGADGKVAVVKTGTGTWNLSGTNNTFTGGIVVSNGTLRVLAHDGKYTWFRWTVKRVRGGGGETACYILGIYDSDNNRMNGGLSLCSDYAAIKAGQVAHQKRMANYYGRGTRDLDKLFDSSARSGTNFNFLEYTATGSARGPLSPDDEGSWIRCLIRLDPDCNEAATYDIAIAGLGNTTPDIWSFEGSVNGVEWDPLHEVAACPAKSAWQWAFGQSSAEASAAETHAGGQAIAGHGLTVARTIPRGCPVAVAPGGVLEAVGTVEVDALSLDAAGNGTFKGVTFAAEGTVFADSLASGSVLFPCTIRDSSGAAMQPDLSEWTLSVGGKVQKGSLRSTSAGIVYSPKGMVIICR